MDECDQEEKNSISEFITKITPHYFKSFSVGMEVDQSQQLDQESQTKVHDISTQIQNFVSVISTIHKTRANDIGSMMFSKDDMMSVEFVSAAANIRANNFGVPMDSLFKVKEMAGKIVPAISSSNALGASLQVTECIKLLAKKTNSLRGIVYQRTNDSVRLNSFSRANDIPNPDCQVCNDAQSIYLVEVKDLKSFTLGDFKAILLEKCGLNGK